MFGDRGNKLFYITVTDYSKRTHKRFWSQQHRVTRCDGTRWWWLWWVDLADTAVGVLVCVCVCVCVCEREREREHACTKWLDSGLLECNCKCFVLAKTYYHLISFIAFRRSVQDCKIRMDMVMSYSYKSCCTTIKYIIVTWCTVMWLSHIIVYLAWYMIKLWHAQNNRSLRNMRGFESLSSYIFKEYVK
jgi:hypothetical protein